MTRHRVDPDDSPTWADVELETEADFESVRRYLRRLDQMGRNTAGMSRADYQTPRGATRGAPHSERTSRRSVSPRGHNPGADPSEPRP